MTVNHDVTGSSPVGGAKTSLFIGSFFNLFVGDKMYYFLDNVYTRCCGILAEDNIYKVRQCEKCKGNFVSYSNPVKFEIHGKPCDYYLFDNINIVSEKFLEVLEQTEITGYEIKDTECINSESLVLEDDKPIKYYELIVTGRCGLIRNINAELLPHCSACRRKFPLTVITHGLSFNQNEWDKSDIFAFDNMSSLPIVTENLKKVLKKAKLVNLKFIELSEYQLF